VARRVVRRDRKLIAMPSSAPSASHYDWIIIGSGFGGSVSALRLAEKGYRVLVLEKGRRFAANEFPRTNWDLARWMWRPSLGLRGIFQMSFFRHVTVLHGVGVGGGSLVYANTLAYPAAGFFDAPSWSALADWRAELEPHYPTARRMLGAARNPRETPGDRILLEIARESGREDGFRPTDVAVYFGPPGETGPDPFFGGAGPDRTGCTFCGACMTGCRVGAKNTLDRNYLYLAEKRGTEVRSETEVIALRARPDCGYVVETKDTFAGYGTRRRLTADRVVCAGGVMGTVPLLLAMREDPEGLPRLSPRVGDFVRTNSEALFAVVAPDRGDLSHGIAITSILHTDEHSHLEPVRYGAGSGFFRLLALPYAPGKTTLARVVGAIASLARNPRLWARALTVPDFARHTQILLYMRTLESNLSLRLGRSIFTGFTRGLITRLDPPGEAPQAFMPDATALAHRFAQKIGGAPFALVTDTLLGTPSTAHILGGACMGASAQDGVIDGRHRAHGYDGLYVIDGSSVSANPGVNPSLTITAMAERAMSFVPTKS
jgi:cholesterol oxidase